MPTKDRFSLSAWIEESVRDFAKSPENSLRNKENEPAFDMPLVGFSSGADPLYAKIKEMIGPFFWTPLRDIQPDLPRPLDHGRPAYRHLLGAAHDARDEGG